MRADQIVGGFQLGEGDRIARIEAYAKRYRDLAQMTRDNVVVDGGTGNSEGFDVFLKGSAGWKVTGRLAYSYIHARRTDPDSGILAPAPADITHAVTLVLERPITRSVNSGIAAHYATGRPYTRVASAIPNSTGGFTADLRPPDGQPGSAPGPAGRQPQQDRIVGTAGVRGALRLRQQPPGSGEHLPVHLFPRLQPADRGAQSLQPFLLFRRDPHLPVIHPCAPHRC